MLNIRRCWLPKQRKCQGFNLLSLFMVIAHRQNFCARTSPGLGSEIRLNDNQNRNHRYSIQGLHSNFSMKRIFWITRALHRSECCPCSILPTTPYEPAVVNQEFRTQSCPLPMSFVVFKRCGGSLCRVQSSSATGTVFLKTPENSGLKRRSFSVQSGFHMVRCGGRRQMKSFRRKDLAKLLIVWSQR